MQFTYTPADENAADMLTKPVDHVTYCTFMVHDGDQLDTYTE